MSKRPVVRIGIFIPSGAQLLDTACVDVFQICSHDYLALMSDMLPSSLIDLAPEVKFLYISQKPAGELVELTAGMNIAVTHHYNDAEVQPGKLDVVLVPGPDPKETWSEGVKKWLAKQGAVETTDVLSVCTGIFLCGEAGLLKGRKASGPRGLQGVIKERFEGVRLVGDEFRWVQDGNFWSSGESWPPFLDPTYSYLVSCGGDSPAGRGLECPS
jgi:transcriptional regulator GlxA family with amidase domain